MIKQFTAFLIAIAICSTAVFAQIHPVDKVFNKYKGKNGFTSVLISGEMFELIGDFTEEESEDDISEIVSGLSGVRILTYEKAETNIKVDLYKEIINAISLNDYKELMSVDDDETNVKFLIKRKDSRVSEFLMIVREPDESTLIWITGNIDLKHLSKISKGLGVKGLDNPVKDKNDTK